MRKILVLTMLLWAAILSVFAQTKNITVSGRLVEDDTKAPAAQATIQLLSLPDSAYVTGAASSENGAFTLPKVRGGKYVMKVSYIGYKTKYVPLQLTASAPNKRLGTLTLESDAIMLAEAVIVAEAPQVQVVVGGAVLTADYAGRIGAHQYARDAMATVRFAEEVYGAGG